MRTGLASAKMYSMLYWMAHTLAFDLGGYVPGGGEDALPKVQRTAQRSAGELQGSRVSTAASRVEGVVDGVENKVRADAARGALPLGEKQGVEDRIGEAEERVAEVTNVDEGVVVFQKERGELAAVEGKPDARRDTAALLAEVDVIEIRAEQVDAESNVLVE